jgi:GNAT superfamily N-acetyltransferase
MTLLIRAATEEDRMSWVRESWVLSYRDRVTHGPAKKMPMREYKWRWRRTVLGLYHSSQVLVAAHESVPGTILGWICYEPSSATQHARIHYVYVEKEAQRRHIASRLLEASGINLSEPCEYSHRTDVLSNLKLPGHWHFCPWLVIGV